MQTSPPSGKVNLDDTEHLQAWLDHFGITVDQLREAVKAAGSELHEVTEHLLYQGGSAGAG